MSEDNGWRPIESAPRDGTRILIYEDFEEAIEGAYWCVEDEEWRAASNRSVFWRDPTHWMPLPPAPEPIT